ncbi:MAG TPA: alpha/beta hydrolase [Rhodoglobus sp.]|nr:alpha/beta hydrolase [Rhodoglobus sp.]
MTLGPVIEAFSMSELAPRMAVVLVLDEVVQPLPDSPPVPDLSHGPTAGAPGGVRGGEVLQQLSARPAGTLESYLREHPGIAQQVLADPPTAASVALWWNTLGADQRREVRAGLPGLIGNLEGVPYPIRDAANRQLLDATIAELEDALSGDAGRAMLDQTAQQLSMLQSVDAALAEGPQRSLLSLDVAGQGRAAIVIGDLRTADYVSYLIPGMFFTIENQLGYWVDAAQRLHEQELDFLDRLDHTEPDRRTVATVAWIGYHTPNLTNIGAIDNARAGAVWLEQALTGLRAVRGADQPYLSVVAHSYGSTAALIALTEGDVEVDALALVGSPGSAARSVDDLHVRDGAVFVGEASWDPVPNSSYFGSDPGAPGYGAVRMGVDGGVDVITGRTLLTSVGHNDYFSPGTASMRNFALIAIGEGRFVTGVDPTRTERALGH